MSYSTIEPISLDECSTTALLQLNPNEEQTILNGMDTWDTSTLKGPCSLISLSHSELLTSIRSTSEESELTLTESQSTSTKGGTGNGTLNSTSIQTRYWCLTMWQTHIPEIKWRQWITNQRPNQIETMYWSAPHETTVGRCKNSGSHCHVLLKWTTSRRRSSFPRGLLEDLWISPLKRLSDSSTDKDNL